MVHLIKEDVFLSVRPSVSLSVSLTQTAYRCQVGPDDGFRLGPIPIGANWPHSPGFGPAYWPPATTCMTI